MSAEASAWAWAQEPRSSGAKLILLCLADQADPLGQCRATGYELAGKCRLTRSTVFKHLAELETHSFLVRSKQRKETRQSANHYELLL